VLLDRYRVVGAALHRGIVAHDHTILPGHTANPGNHAGTRGSALIEPVRRRGPNLKKGRTGIEQIGNPLTREHFAPAQVPLACRSAAPFGGQCGSLLDLGQGIKMRRAVGIIGGTGGQGRAL